MARTLEKSGKRQEPRPRQESLQKQYHSLCARDRRTVVELLSEPGDPDGARELIDLHRDCGWRETRFDILRALGRNASPRALEFLIKTARDDHDIPMAEAAIRALAETRDPWAARFLVNLYRKGPASLKTACVGALGVLPDRTCAAELVKDLEEALTLRRYPLLRTLVLTLGELKIQEATPLFERILLEIPIRDLQLCALISLGKTSRNPQQLERHAGNFGEDLFQRQLLNTARQQVRIRSELSAADYVNRIFESRHFHRTLPYELLAFPESEVLEQLEHKARVPENFQRLCRTLARLPLTDIAAAYERLIPLEKLAPRQAEQCRRSMSRHHRAELEVPLRKLERHFLEDAVKWLATAALCLPHAESEFKNWLESSRYSELSELERIDFLNALERFALSGLCVPSQVHGCGQIAEKCLDDESEKVHARAIRVLAAIEFTSPRTQTFLRKKAKASPATATSCLLHLEKVPCKEATETLLGMLGARDARGFSAAPVLRALRYQCKLPADAEPLRLLLRESLSRNSDDESTHEALMLLDAHPDPGLLSDIQSCLARAGRVKLAAVIALRANGTETSADALLAELGPAVRQADHSLAGRIIDTLCHLPGARPRRILLDHLTENALDEDLCDKLIRCLIPEAGKSTPYFVEALDALIADYREHPQLDGLIQLRERFAATLPLEQNHIKAGLLTAEIRVIEESLASRIPEYERLDEATRSALRSAETPFLHPALFNESIDKSASVLEYCKGIDLLLERELGRKLLFPRLNSNLADFQNVLHAHGLTDGVADTLQVMNLLGVERHFTPQNFPLHKLLQMAQVFLNGRITQDPLKHLDGLRAWAVVILIFARKTKLGTKPPLPLKSAPEEEILQLARGLTRLQDIRNPVAHRQTLQALPALEEIRGLALEVLNRALKLLG